MNISDLNHFEVQEANVVGGSGYYRPLTTSYYKNVDVKENYKLTDYKWIVADAFIWGNVGTANAGAEAYGKNTDAQTYSASLTTDYSSAAISSSISATGYDPYH